MVRGARGGLPFFPAGLATATAAPVCLALHILIVTSHTSEKGIRILFHYDRSGPLAGSNVEIDREFQISILKI